MSEKVKRRLTTVFCADVKDYTRLMESDEADTLARLRLYRERMKALIERHDGRVINTWGDALIAEFGSVVEAVHAAVEVQKELADRNHDLSGGEQMWFRIGINLGDVMVEGNDIYGEGVNIAARLQEIAEPGGILISRPVFDQVRNKLSVGFDFVGDQSVKNVSDPVSSYRILVDGSAAPARKAQGQGPVPGESVPGRSTAGEASSWTRFRQLPAVIKTAMVVVAFFFTLNLSSGLDSIWFHWPSLPMIAIILLYFSLRRPRDKAP